MTQFNIFSIGNHISNGAGSITKKESTRGDTRWKKFIQQHPDNLYRSYTDYIAQMLDANIYYLGKADSGFRQIINVFKNSVPNIKKNHPDDINVYFLNLCSVPYNWKDFDKENKSIDDDVERLKHQVDFYKGFNLDLEAMNYLVDNLDTMGWDYNNRLIIITPSFENLYPISEHSNLVSHDVNNKAFKELGTINKRVKGDVLSKEVQPFVEVIDADIQKLLLGRPIDKKLTYDDQKELGENLYFRLTQSTELFII